jgi:hypothetical protein
MSPTSSGRMEIELDGARAAAADVLATDAMTGALAAHHALEILRDADGAVDWSSAGLLPMHPLDGDLTRRYRVGDHAAEIIHSLERAHFIRERFTGPYR